MAKPEKVCVLCRQDCSTRPRTKNPEGQYACNACLAGRRKQSKTKTSERAAVIDNRSLGLDEPKLEPLDVSEDGLYALEDAGDPAMAGLLDDIPDPVDTARGTACPGCAKALPEGAAMCTNCGHNMMTGRGAKTKVKQNAPGEGFVNDAARATGRTMVPVMALIGAGIGGLLGAGIWAAVAHFLHVESGWIAWGVGGLCGMGVAVATSGGGGMLGGVLAAVVAIAAIGGGKYWAVSIVVDQGEAEFVEVVQDTMAMVTDEDMKGLVTDEIASEWEASGRTVDWKDGASLDTAMYPIHYPQDLIEAGTARYDAMSTAELDQMREDWADEIIAAVHGVALDSKMQGFESMWNLFDVIFVLLAVATAFKIGSVGHDG
ncbi:MAG: hypothetical protein AAF297_10845 [Planctomycetota bacterium]